ncbi:MAG: putative ABC transport system permease protein [Halieaceae bacterium]|jgi:putative ABC transport system permease protein
MPLLLRMLVRDWRGGELGVLLAALVLAVTMVSGISGFAATLKGALRQESHSFLAADIAVRDSRALPASWLHKAREGGLQAARTLSFNSMVFAGDEGVVLSSVKAVSDDYPLRGAVRLSDEAYSEQRAQQGGPGRGTVWIEPRLFGLLQVDVGDEVGIGTATFRVAAAIRGEPDRAGGFLGVGPRVMLHIDDIPATGVVQPGSRVSYRQLFAGTAEAVEEYTSWLEPQLEPGQRLQTVSNSQPAVGRALQRAERFLLLAGSLAVILAGVAISLAARRYAERHQNYVALLKSLGAQSARIRGLYAASLLANWLLAVLLGWLLAYGIQALALGALDSEFSVKPVLWQPRPYLIGAVTALVCLGCFAWPSLSRLAMVSPLRVLRSDLPLHGPREAVDYLLGLAAICGLMWWYSADLMLTLVVVGGLLAVIACGGLLALGLLRGGRVIGMQAGSVWRLALASLQRHGLGNALQLVVFAVAIMLLLLLTLLRTSLLDDWQNQLPEGAPNHFLLNIAPAELGAVSTLLEDGGVPSEKLYPMLRGRIIGVAGAALPTKAETEGGPQQREANFTWSRDIPEGNELLAGSWWQGESNAEVSVEAEFAERLGIAIGDELELRIGASDLRVRVTSLRSLDWESLKPNFFMVFPPGLLESYPVTYMTSFYLSPERKTFLNTLLREHPTATVIEVDAIMEQLRSTLGQVASVIELILSLVLLAGILVLVAGVQSTVDLRLSENALLRALGAGRSHILGAVAIEFSALGLMSGVLAVLAAEGAFWALQTLVFQGDYHPTPWLWLPTVVLATALIATLGLWNCRRVVSVPPVVVLRGG